MTEYLLDEVCDIYQPKTISQEEMIENGEYFVFGANGIIGRYDKYNHEESEVAITCRGATCGTVNLTLPKSWITGNAMVVTPKIGDLRKKYLYYYMKFVDLSKVITGTAQPQITRTNLKNVTIKVPSLEDQERIIEELDKVDKAISNRIEAEKKLEELINSTFKSMFGDPLKNEKGWQEKKLEEFAELLNGRAYKQSELLDKGKDKIIRVGNLFSNNSYYYSDLDLDDDKYIDNGDLIYAWSASLGARIWHGEKVVYHYHIWKVNLKEDANKYFVMTMLNYLTDDLRTKTHGITMIHLTKAGMEKTRFILPPIKLQEEYEKYFKKIERQIEIIKSEIVSLNELLDSKMHHYFEVNE